MAHEDLKEANHCSSDVVEAKANALFMKAYERGMNGEKVGLTLKSGLVASQKVVAVSDFMGAIGLKDPQTLSEISETL